MRKIILSLLFFFAYACTNYIVGQTNQESMPFNPLLPIIIPESPHAMQYMRYGQIPINISTGIPEISIPIYTLKANGLEIPINISYHASGIKVKDIASSVGLGWVLNAGGMIAQTVYGWSDTSDDGESLLNIPFSSAQEAAQKIYEEYNANNGFIDRKWNSYLGGNIEKTGNMPYYPSKSNLISDRFTFNFNEYIGSFRYNLSKNIYETIPHSPLKIEIKKDSFKDIFVITDENGIKWSFSEMSESQLVDYAFDPISAKEYYLTSINFPGISDPVLFTYVLGQEYETKNYTESVFNGEIANFFVTEELTGYIEGYRKLNTRKTNYRNLSCKKIKSRPVYIKDIRWKDILITFNYSADRNGLIKERLENIIVESGDSSASTIFSHIDKDERMLLNGIIVNNEEYKFYYNGGTLPAINPEDDNLYFSEDYWGYYNNARSKRELIPFYWVDILVDSIKNTEIDLSGISSTLNTTQRIYTPIREPNFTSTLNKTLSEIHYPTKGKTTFKYELNRGENVYHNLKPKASEIENFGGLRIRQISTYDKDGKLQYWKTYEYFGGEPSITLTDLHFVSQKPFYYIPVAPLSQTALGSGAIIINEIGANGTELAFSVLGGQSAFYSKVIEYYGHIGLNEGKVEYLFKKDSLSENLCNESNPYWKAMYINNCDRGVINPLLVSKKEFEYENGTYNLVQETSNFYKRTNIGSYITGINVSHTYEFQPSVNQFILASTGGMDLYNRYYQGFSFEDIRAIKDLMVLDKTIITNHKNYINKVIAYKYDPMYRLLSPIETSVATSVSGDTITEKITHPFNHNIAPYTYMVEENILRPIITQQKYKNNQKLLSTIQNNYKKIGNLYLIDNISSSQGISPLEKRIQFHNYDSYGNPIYLLKDSAEHIVYLWGNKGEHPIAEIRNATYFDVKSALGNTLPEYLSSLPPNMDIINLLRDDSINLFNAHVSTYTYDPLFGMTSITDPRGIKTLYNYDKYGRLINIKDNQDNIITSYSYNYSNESAPIGDIESEAHLSSNSEYVLGNKVTFTMHHAKVTNGNFKYNWIYKSEKTENILIQEFNSTNSQLTINLDNEGAMIVICNAMDISTGKVWEAVKRINITKPKHEIYFSNIVKSEWIGQYGETTAEIHCSQETNIKIGLFGITNDKNKPTAYCTIGNTKIQINPTGLGSTAEQIIKLPSGVTKVKIRFDITSFNEIEIKLRLLEVLDEHSEIEVPAEISTRQEAIGIM